METTFELGRGNWVEFQQACRGEKGVVLGDGGALL